jgi:cardiolipin synthase
MKLKKILILPNILTILRILISPVFLILLLKSRIIAGLVVFILVALTDALDGMIARGIKQKTRFGMILDPMADKVMVAFAVIALIIKFDFPTIGLLIFSRGFVSLCGSYLVYKKRKGSWEATKLGKATTFFQVVTIIAFLIDNTFKSHLLALTIIISIITAVQYAIIGIRITRSSK